MSMLFAAALAQATTSPPRFDHTADMAVVAGFLADIRQGRAKGSEIEVMNRDNPANANFAYFQAYANECQIKRMYAIPGTSKRMPVSVEWDCGRFINVSDNPIWEVRYAGFWVKNGRVVRIVFGKIPTIPIPALSPKPIG